jgi:Cys-Gly metallodipeptidase DUG1
MADVERMADWLLSQLTSLGVKAEKRPIGHHQLGGKEVPLPPVVIGQIGQDPKKASLILLCVQLRITW